MRRNRIVSLLVLVASCEGFLVTPRVRADCHSVPECMLNLGVGKLDSKVTTIVAATAFTGLAVAGAAVQARHMYDREMPDGVVVVSDNKGKQHLELVLIPVPPPVQLTLPDSEVDRRESRGRTDGMFRFNDTATNVALAAGGAAILGSIIAEFAKKH